MNARVDHLVIAARTLDEGVQWCEATLGVKPWPGGAHASMGTHNRLLSIASPAFPQAYLEIIAIDSVARPTRAAPLRRWFDLDDQILQASLAHHGPHLIHFVAAVPDLHAAVTALAGDPLRIDRGHVVHAFRELPEASGGGRIEWQIAVRDDGQRLFYGALPTLIQWGLRHPADDLPDDGLALLALEASHPRIETLRAALDAIAFDAMSLRQGAPDLVATLRTPRGVVTLGSRITSYT
ncbi:VOC family protein [Variovorax sp. RHLX14]|uniref:VOC family protein n=1 Tax=Variovorax sp. RHLX14 TaxID=1259731 RepID=UPI003F466F77